jgi:small acid-soluble spore protein H (minor)
MDEKRAREIAASPVMANVTYDGEPVYIENVNKQSANIHSLYDPSQRQTVSLADLVEHPGEGGGQPRSRTKYGQPPY